MNANLTIRSKIISSIASLRHGYLLRSFFAGILIPFGFAPFHFPGVSILGLALLFATLKFNSVKNSFRKGFVFGLGFFSFGISWVYISINEYGHLGVILSALITLLLIIYLSFYLGLFSSLYVKLAKNKSMLFSCLLFSSLWCLTEYLRSTVISGFPWLLLGVSQMDSPLKYLMPIVGIYGVSFFTCLSATFLIATTETVKVKRVIWLIAFVSVLLAPLFLKSINFTKTSDNQISVGVIQANLSMRDKWDENLFWQILQKYKEGIEQLIGKTQLIVLPEAAIPIPENYISDEIDNIHRQTDKANTAVLLGIPEATSSDESYYYNTITSLGRAKGRYKKQHLVIFGEYIPRPFESLMNYLALPSSNLKPGQKNQELIEVAGHPIATLICYELAYPKLLRNQLPKAEWIVSISDDGWFGKSLALYQHLQMAQALSLLTGRYQIMSNNDGLSSIINEKGTIVNSLPAFSEGILEGNISGATGITPWVFYGDTPIILFFMLAPILAFVRRNSLDLYNPFDFL